MADPARALHAWESEGGHLLQREGWSRALELAELEDGAVLGLVLAGVPVCLVRTGPSVHALLDECSHAQVRLSEGDVDQGSVECWRHGSCFDLVTGRPSGPPATVPVPVFPVRILDGVVEVHLPAPAGQGGAA